MLKRHEIDDYTDDPHNWNNLKLYGALKDPNSNDEIGAYDKFFAVETQTNKFLHADTFSNGEIFMFCTLLQVSNEPIGIYNVFLNKQTFLELVSNDKMCIGKCFCMYIILK